MAADCILFNRGELHFTFRVFCGNPGVTGPMPLVCGISVLGVVKKVIVKQSCTCQEKVDSKKNIYQKPRSVLN